MKTIQDLAFEMTRLLPPHVAVEWVDKIKKTISHARAPELCIPVPLIGGETAELAIPRTMTRANMLHLRRSLIQVLLAMESAIITEASTPYSAIPQPDPAAEASDREIIVDHRAGVPEMKALECDHEWDIALKQCKRCRITEKAWMESHS